jgi:hypothetical protein
MKVLDSLLSTVGPQGLRTPAPLSLKALPPAVLATLEKLLPPRSAEGEHVGGKSEFWLDLLVHPERIQELYRELKTAVERAAQPPRGYPAKLAPLAEKLVEKLAEKLRQFPLLASDAMKEELNLLTALIDDAVKEGGFFAHVGEEEGQALLRHLAPHRTRSAAQPTPPLLAAIEGAVKRLEANTRETAEREGEELQTVLATVLEEVERRIAAQEVLSRLNPVMHALNEPIVILLPLLFHGMMQEGEIALDLDDRKEPTDPERRGSEPRRRLSLTVPLPELGAVGVELALGAEEIALHLTVSSEEARSFLEERFSELRLIFAANGFLKTTLHTQVGNVSPPETLWTEILRHHTSIIA